MSDQVAQDAPKVDAESGQHSPDHPHGTPHSRGSLEQELRSELLRREWGYALEAQRQATSEGLPPDDRALIDTVLGLLHDIDFALTEHEDSPANRRALLRAQIAHEMLDARGNQVSWAQTSHGMVLRIRHRSYIDPLERQSLDMPSTGGSSSEPELEYDLIDLDDAIERIEYAIWSETAIPADRTPDPEQDDEDAVGGLPLIGLLGSSESLRELIPFCEPTHHPFAYHRPDRLATSSDRSDAWNTLPHCALCHRKIQPRFYLCMNCRLFLGLQDTDYADWPQRLKEVAKLERQERHSNASSYSQWARQKDDRQEWDAYYRGLLRFSPYPDDQLNALYWRASTLRKTDKGNAYVRAFSRSRYLAEMVKDSVYEDEDSDPLGYLVIPAISQTSQDYMPTLCSERSDVPREPEQILEVGWVRDEMVDLLQHLTPWQLKTLRERYHGSTLSSIAQDNMMSPQTAKRRLDDIENKLRQEWSHIQTSAQADQSSGARPT